jgi:hypothetical protein
MAASTREASRKEARRPACVGRRERVVRVVGG